MANVTPATSTGSGRIESLDQFRGWAIFVMVVVNYLGQYALMPETFRHHHYGMSFADLAVPSFLFAVGIGYRLSFLRRMERDGIWRARRAALKRYTLLIIVGYLIYGHGVHYEAPWFWRSFNRNFWDALVEIGFSGLLLLPVIERGPIARVVLGFFYCALYQGLYDFAGYGEWVQHNAINGGPLGVLTHAFPLVLGTVAYDLLMLRDRRRFIMGAFAAGASVMVLGYALSYYWVFSLRYATVSYLIFSAGICMLVYLAFYLLADVAKIKVPTFTAMGRNALTIYIAQQFLLEAHVLPEWTPAVIALAVFVILYGALYGAARYLDRSGYYIRL